MNITTGLSIGEIILLGMGVILFLTLIAGFFIQLKNDKLKLSYAGFFMIPIIMIAFPSIKHITVLDTFLKIETLTKELEEHPNNEAAKAELENYVEVLPKTQGVISDDMAITTAKAYTVLEKPEKAEEHVNKVLQSNPEDITAQKIKARIDVMKAKGILEHNPEDKNAQQLFAKQAKKLQKLGSTNQFDEMLIKDVKPKKGKKKP